MENIMLAHCCVVMRMNLSEMQPKRNHVKSSAIFKAAVTTELIIILMSQTSKEAIFKKRHYSIIRQFRSQNRTCARIR